MSFESFMGCTFTLFILFSVFFDFHRDDFFDMPFQLTMSSAYIVFFFRDLVQFFEILLIVEYIYCCCQCCLECMRKLLALKVVAI